MGERQGLRPVHSNNHRNECGRVRLRRTIDPNSLWCVGDAPYWDYTRRAQAITWKVWEDNACYDPACLQSIWCRIIFENDRPLLNMNVRFRSNDAYKAAFMNMFALTHLQAKIAARVSELSDQPISLGRYCHVADSFHIYGSNLPEFEARFLGAIQKRTFEQRTMRYEDVRDIMESAKPAILERARRMGRT